MNSYTYKDAGVDIDAGAETVEAIKPLVRSTRRPGADSDIGGFAGIFDLKAAGYNDPLLLAATDGVGTKLRIAIDCERHNSIGIDLVAMCVNDLVVQGAEPLFFLDYYATGKLTPAIAAAVVEGIAAGCREAGCALIGGETAEMPGLYAQNDYDLAGFAVGAVERGQLLSGEGVEAGDVLLGIGSSGLHANGFSLVRRLLDDHGFDHAAPAPFQREISLGEALLAPTRIYVKSCLELQQQGLVKAMAHITGGGFQENIPRMLSPGLGVEIDGAAWQPPAVFGWLSQLGGIAIEEMTRTFNCGVGLVAVLGRDEASAAMALLEAAGEGVQVIGTVVERDSDRPAVAIDGLKF